MKVDVAIPKTKLDFFTYNSQNNLQVGDLVLVPLRNKLKYGIVIKTDSQREVRGIKDVKELIEKKFIPTNLLKLYKWMADYYLATLGEVLRLALPSKILKKYEYTKRPKVPIELAKTPIPTYPQNNAINRINEALKSSRFETFLLYGITGSGKTEVYLRCVEEVIKSGGRSLVLVPEISMTPLLFRRFQERFKNDVITIHSSLTDKERKTLWFAIKKGTTPQGYGIAGYRWIEKRACPAVSSRVQRRPAATDRGCPCPGTQSQTDRGGRTRIGLGCLRSSPDPQSVDRIAVTVRSHLRVYIP